MPRHKIERHRRATNRSPDEANEAAVHPYGVAISTSLTTSLPKASKPAFMDGDTCPNSLYPPNNDGIRATISLTVAVEGGFGARLDSTPTQDCRPFRHPIPQNLLVNTV